MRITLRQPADNGPPNPVKPFAVDATVGESEDGQILRILLTEVADLTKAMREMLMTADRFINFAGLIAVGALTIGLIKHDEGKNWLALVFAPYGIALAFGYLIQIYTEVEKRAGYKRFLEARVNSLVGRPVLLESQINSRVERNRKSVIGMQVLNAMGFFGLIALSAKETVQRYGDEGPEIRGLHLLNLNTLNIALLAFSVFVLGLALRENMQASGKAYRQAAALQGNHAPPPP
ncbi:hypothetical protein [Actinomadura sp. 6K520]|jgi:hypothetical protein|uniref:hypothetical protein n=1 Tax=Actinomadura sp. 6K520 TaxID=2530364 RepID=UPI001404549C|nr:hypothetical protein [Actinomadura sp. 6K520]